MHPARKAQRRLRLLRPRAGLHRLPGPPAPVPYLAVLGEQRRLARAVARDVPGLPRFRSGRAVFARGDNSALACHPPVEDTEVLLTSPPRPDSRRIRAPMNR